MEGIYQTDAKGEKDTLVEWLLFFILQICWLHVFKVYIGEMRRVKKRNHKNFHQNDDGVMMTIGLGTMT